MSQPILQSAISERIKKHGSLRKAAAAMKISAPYLSMVNNNITLAGPAVLSKLGLERTFITFKDGTRKPIYKRKAAKVKAS